MPGNKNDLAYLNINELQTGLSITAATELIYVNPTTRIPFGEGTVQDILDLVEADDFDNPMTAVGDIIMGTTAGAPARLAVGTVGQALLTDGTDPEWGDVYQNPMTTAGDLTVGGASGAPDRLAIGAVGTFLGGGTTPAWVSGVISAQVAVTLTELNAGKTIIAAVTGKQIVVVDFNFVMDGSFGSLTSAELEDASATINVCSLAQAQMSDNAVLTKDTAGVTLGVGIAEGLTVSEALVITVTGSAADTATGLTVVVTYMLV